MSSTGVRYTTVQSSDRPVTLSVGAGAVQADRLSVGAGPRKPDRLSVGAGPGQTDRKPRYIQRDGSCRLALEHVPGHLGLYVTDIFTTLVEIRWRVMFLLFSLSYILSWLFFGLLYWIIALAHGDLVAPSDNGPCMDNVRSFTAAFLFSLETQTTIGYGFRGMTENCAVAIALVTVQDVLSCFIDTVVIGIVVAKMASARKRAQTVGFSSWAVVSRQDGRMGLSWRLGDFRTHHMVEGVATAQLVRLRQLSSGEVGVSYQDLPLQQSEILLVTPTTVTHPIAPGSPLYGLSMLDLYREDFELVVSFTYTDDSTGILHQTRSSYRPAQIRWGARFKDVLLVNGQSYRADYALFHETVPVQLHARSAQDQDRSKPEDPAPNPAPTRRSAPRPSPRPSPRPASTPALTNCKAPTPPGTPPPGPLLGPPPGPPPSLP